MISPNGFITGIVFVFNKRNYDFAKGSFRGEAKNITLLKARPKL
jgi:hypothetical protein